MWFDVILLGLVMAATTLWTIDFYLPGGFFEGVFSLEVARTAGFTVLVFAQLFNVFNSRSEIRSAFAHAFVNPWLIGAVLLGVVLQIAVVNMSFLNTAFGTAPLTIQQWSLLYTDGFCRVVGERMSQVSVSNGA